MTVQKGQVYKQPTKRKQPRKADGTFTFCEELDQRQQDMIVELITNGGNKTEACRTLDIPRSTLYKWLDNKLFQEAYKKACEHVYKEALADAVKTMVGLMKCDDKRTALKATEDVMRLNGYLDAKVDIGEKPTEIKITLEDNRE